jgi:deazaflavin-dependent oxidoreductase (nitroreductase family)
MTAPDEEPIYDSPTGWVAKHIRGYAETDGKDGHSYQGIAALLLTTRGRKSQKLRRTALYYGEDDGRYLVVASNGGSSRHPSWYLNLTERPEVDVQVGADTFRARARVATAEEKPELWRQMVAIFPMYARYQAKAGRDIPLVILERI